MKPSHRDLEIPEFHPCPFCAYLSGRRPFTILDRNELSAILVTREQRGIGHLLVLPVRHAETISDMAQRESHAVIDDLRRAALAIEEAYRVSGISVWQNNGIPADQAIPHVHFHIAGTLPAGGTERGDVTESPLEETDEIAHRVRPFLRRAEN